MCYANHMRIKNIKFFSYFTIVIILTLGLSISLQSILAWTAPSASPPTCATGNPGCDEPLNISNATQQKIGGLVLNTGGIATNGLIVDQGNVGIGTVGPDRKLDILDGSSPQMRLTQADNSVYADFQMTSGGDLVMNIDGQSNQLVLDNNGNVGIGIVDPGYELEVNGDVAALAFIYASDESLKKDIQKIDNALLKIQQLEGVSFKWKKNSQPNLGLIAQDLEEVFPELVSTNENTGLKSVQYGNLVAPLIEAVKEQQKKIQELEDRIEKLEIKN